MASRVLRSVLGCLIAIVLLAGAFSGGLLMGWLVPLHHDPVSAQPTPVTIIAEPAPTPVPGATLAPIDPDELDSSPNSSGSLFTPFWQAWQIVHDQYVDQPVDDTSLMQGAIRGMLDALGDKHSSYMDPDQYRQATIPMEGEYEGIGAWVDDTTSRYLTVTSPMPGSPAEKAGLKTGDQVIAVDGKDVTGIDPKIVLRSVLGPAGTAVTLTILREGAGEPIDVTIIRAKITVPSLDTRMLDGKIAYIALYDFGEGTGKQLHQALGELMRQEPVGMILDLRNNGGGYLSTSIEVVSEFIPAGIVLVEQYGDGSEKSYSVISGGLATKIPLVVLVNEGTASASEIVAGAIQDYGRGKLVGMTTYGKGSVQNWIELPNDQGAVRVTIARWLTPHMRQINDVGLTPDVTVQLTESDIQNNNDQQLKTAIELINP